jgi:hypothetical protein
MESENCNLEVLKKSKKSLRPGDIFVLKPKGHNYYFGRVIDTNAQSGFGPVKAMLIYIYNATSKDKNHIPELRKDNLLIPPTMINRLGWSKGYFENVAFRNLSEDDIMNIHCFWDPMFKKYMNERGEELDGPYEPVCLYGLGNYRVVDDNVSEALGIPLAPD